MHDDRNQVMTGQLSLWSPETKTWSLILLLLHEWPWTAHPHLAHTYCTVGKGRVAGVILKFLMFVSAMSNAAAFIIIVIIVIDLCFFLFLET